jgi:trimethylamine--corrinoid protein Co-methyltransferase
VDLYARDGSHRIVLEGRATYFGTSGTTPYSFDPVSGQRQANTRKSIAQIARVCDFLPQFDWAMVLGVPSDCPSPIADRVGFVAAVGNFTKTIYSSAYSVEGLADLVEMCEVIAGGAAELHARPFFITGIDPISPLVYSREVAGKLMLMAKKGLPFLFNPGAMAGATGPATLAGILSLNLAENLAGLVLAQAVRPGTPVILGGGPGPMDMSTTVYGYGAPETAVLSTALADVAHSYGIPVSIKGGASNARTVDEQSALEATFSLVTAAAQAGAGLVHDVGTMDAGMTCSMEQLVLCNEVIDVVRQIMKGMEVSAETLAFDVIEKVGPGGHYLAEEHTLHHFREHHRSPLLDRQRYEAWFDKGAHTLGQRLSERVRQVLDAHVPPPLSEDTLKGLDAIVRRAETQLCQVD